MRTVQYRKVAACIAATGALTAGLLLAPSSSSAHGAHITTVLTGLNAPRGITFDNRGNLYVSESGVAGSGSAGLTNTGRVSKYEWGSTTPEWSTSFESLFVTEDPSQPPDVLGPEGISASCPDRERDYHARPNGHHDHHRGGCKVQVIMSESHDGVAALTNGAIQTKDAGHLYGLDPKTGAPTDLSNVGDQSYAFTNAHKHLFPSDFPDANPYGVLVVRDHHGDYHNGVGGRDHHHHGGTRTFVVDAAANTVNEIMRDGTMRVVAYIPNEHRKPFRDSTPTCAAMGPDGYLYVGTLDLLANFASPHRSKIYRVDPNGNFPTRGKLWARGGLAFITSCTFDKWGNFWATEMFRPTSGPPGDVVKIPFNDPSKRQYIGAGQLPLPGGITQGPDGAMYVSVNSANPEPGSGAVMRISTYHHHHH